MVSFSVQLWSPQNGLDQSSKEQLDLIPLSQLGISLLAAAAGGGSNSGNAGVMIISEEFQAKKEQFAAQHIELYMCYLMCDCHAGDMALLMFYDIIFSHLTTVDHEITVHCMSLLNCADPELLTSMQHHINQVDPSKGKTYQLAKQFGQQSIESTWEIIGQPPMYKDGKFASISDQ